MVRNSCLIVVLFSVFPAAAQVTNCAAGPTSERECNHKPEVSRNPVGSLMWSDTSLFQRQPDGSFRVRRTPLFRPSLDRRPQQ